MNILTHRKIDRSLCGTPAAVESGTSRVQFTPTADMVVDDYGLVHGGFVFGLADHAAMIAVNDPNVVLGGADVRFLKPVKTGEALVAEAEVKESAGKKRLVVVTVNRGSEAVFSGTFTCFVLDKHVLA